MGRRFWQYTIAAAAVLTVSVLACTPLANSPGTQGTPTPAASSTTAQTQTPTPAPTATTTVTTSTELFPVVAGTQGPKQVGSAFAGVTKCTGCHSEITDKYKATGHWNPREATGNRPGNFGLKSGTNASTNKSETGFYLTQRSGSCRACHVVGLATATESIMVNGQPAGFNMEADVDSTQPFNTSEDANPNAKFMGIQCESCHGPGANHVTAAAADKKASITRTPNFNTTCGSCHIPGTYKQVWPDTGATDNDVNKNAGSGGHVSHPNYAAYMGTGGYNYGEVFKNKNAHFTKLGNGCVNCHFAGAAPNNHTIHIKTDRAAHIATCQKCHGSDFTSASLDAFQAQTKLALKGFEEAQALYKAEHCKKVFISSSKTFSTASDKIAVVANLCAEWDDTPTAGKTTAATASANPLATSSNWSDNMKIYNRASYNYGLAEAEESFGVHNPTYTQSLLRLGFNEMAGKMQSAASSPSFQALSLKLR